MRFKRLTGSSGYLKQLGLEPRAALALAVVAIGLFLTISLAKYGGAAEAGSVSWHVGLAGWFVDVFGAGAWLFVLLPTVWGVIVYFRESTPNLAIRAGGVLVLACATAMITGLLQGAEPGPWAGSVGAFAVWLTEALSVAVGSAIAAALVWTGTIVLFVTSLIWATDWMFYSVRRGADMPLTLGVRHVALEPSQVELREPGEYAAERELIRAAAPPAEVADAVRATGTVLDERTDDETGLPHALGADASVPDVTDFVQIDMGQEIELSHDSVLPTGFTAREDDGRTVVKGPSGYRGVEFLPQSDELLEPEAPEVRAYDIGSLFTPPAVEYAETPVLAEHVPEEPVQAEPVQAEHQEFAPDPTPEPVSNMRPASIVGPLSNVAPGMDAEIHAEFDAVEPDPEPEPAFTPPAVELIDEDLVPLVEPPVAIAPPLPPIFAEPLSEASPETLPAEILAAETAEPGARKSGIGLPGDSPFIDEFFPAATSTDLPAAHETVSAYSPGDGAASHEEVAATYGSTPPVSSSMPETVTSAEMLPPAETAVTPGLPEPAPVARQFAEGGTSTPPVSRLDRLHSMQLDPLFGAAVSAVFDGGRGSPMVLQRRLGIGHGRGLRILAQMAEAGLVGPEDPTGSRSLQLSRSAWEAFVGGHQL